ncbi:hypothetical protein AAFN86_15975 [Roseomonas sp. CAU 1739]
MPPISPPRRRDFVALSHALTTLPSMPGFAPRTGGAGQMDVMPAPLTGARFTVGLPSSSNRPGLRPLIRWNLL